MASKQTGVPPTGPFDEDWLIEQARGCKAADIYEAKSWLITAKALYPRSAKIQFEIYLLEKTTGNVSVVAALLSEMFSLFPQDNLLQEEVKTICQAIQCESVDDSTKFYQELFAKLPPGVQCGMLLKMADITRDIIQHCKLLLLIVDRYPEQVSEQRIKLVESLVMAEQMSEVASPLNQYRRYLVCDVLPLLLHNNNAHLYDAHLYDWLQYVIEFYVAYITAAKQRKALSNANDKQRSEVTGVSKKQSLISNLSDCIITEPWSRLYELVQLIGDRLGWSTGRLFSEDSVAVQWQMIKTMSADNVQQQRRVFYCTVVIYLRSLYNYMTTVKPESFDGEQPLVLVETFHSSVQADTDEPVVKKDKLDLTSPELLVKDGATDVVKDFQICLHCHELLTSQCFDKEFQSIMHKWHSSTWSWTTDYELDRLLYQNNHKEVARHLEMTQHDQLSSVSQIRFYLRQLSCYTALGSYQKSYDVVRGLLNISGGAVDVDTYESVLCGSGVRQLQLMCCTQQHILPYCVHVVIAILKNKMISKSSNDDALLGHLLVLIQFDWPMYEDLFYDIISAIKKQGSFSYSLFFVYIVTVEMLEEFALLKMPGSGKINLDIMPTSTKTLTQTRTVTRGVNKGVKEDLKVALEKQVLRSIENVEKLIRQFLLDEVDVLKQHIV